MLFYIFIWWDSNVLTQLESLVVYLSRNRGKYDNKTLFYLFKVPNCSNIREKFSIPAAKIPQKYVTQVSHHICINRIIIIIITIIIIIIIIITTIIIIIIIFIIIIITIIIINIF